MLSSILSILGRCISFCYDIFTSFLSGSFLSLFLSMFMIFLVYRLIIKPLVGLSVGSDKVKKSNNVQR